MESSVATPTVASVTAATFREHFECGRLDRAAGSVIMTKDQHRQSCPAGSSLEDIEDLYRAYRNGFTTK